MQSLSAVLYCKKMLYMRNKGPLKHFSKFIYSFDIEQLCLTTEQILVDLKKDFSLEFCKRILVYLRE